jgi:hypothetical protein
MVTFHSEIFIEGRGAKKYLANSPPLFTQRNTPAFALSAAQLEPFREWNMALCGKVFASMEVRREKAQWLLDSSLSQTTQKQSQENRPESFASEKS